MRYLLIASFVLASVLSTVVIAEEPNSKGIKGFESWAIEQSKNMDRNWNNILSGNNLSNRHSRTSRVTKRRSPTPHSWKVGTDVSSTVWPSSYYTYTKPTNPQFLPLTTRKRSSASRGHFNLRHPARVRLSSAGKFRRTPFKGISSKNFFSSGKSISRPRLNSIHRTGRGHSRRRNPTRPASDYRISRPSRRFRW